MGIVLLLYSTLFGNLRLCTWGAVHVLLNYFYFGFHKDKEPKPKDQELPHSPLSFNTDFGDNDVLSKVDMEITRRLKEAEQKIAQEYIYGFDLNLPQGNSNVLSQVRLNSVLVERRSPLNSPNSFRD
jgi:hypothetical protein